MSKRKWRLDGFDCLTGGDRVGGLVAWMRDGSVYATAWRQGVFFEQKSHATVLAGRVWVERLLARRKRAKS